MIAGIIQDEPTLRGGLFCVWCKSVGEEQNIPEKLQDKRLSNVAFFSPAKHAEIRCTEVIDVAEILMQDLPTDAICHVSRHFVCCLRLQFAGCGGTSKAGYPPVDEQGAFRG